MRRLFWILAGVLAAVAVPASLAVTIGTPPATTQSIVNNGAGDQTDPHVSGSLVSYTSCTAWACRIHYHDLATGTDAVIPTTVSPISGATWIWAPGITGATTPAELAQYFFSKSITLAAAPTAASFLVAVDDFAELRINGTVVGTTGSTTDKSVALAAQSSLKSLNILPHLTAGANTITIRAQNGIGSFGGCTNCTYQQNPAGVVFGGSITAGGSAVTVASDTSWQVFDVDPATAGATSLGSAQNVCLNASSPVECPSGATLYGFPGASWTATTPLGEDDFLSDVSGTRIVFTRVSTTSAIYLYDTATGASAVELAPSSTANRRHAAIGGSTVAWQDFGFHASSITPEIVVHEIADGTTFTTDALLDRNVAVSPDGNVVLWAKCQTTGTGCDIWKAVKAGGAWSASAVTGASGEEHQPATDGQRIVYVSTRSGGRTSTGSRSPGELSSRSCSRGCSDGPPQARGSSSSSRSTRAETLTSGATTPRRTLPTGSRARRRTRSSPTSRFLRAASSESSTRRMPPATSTSTRFRSSGRPCRRWTRSRNWSPSSRAST